jgi:precorrin-2 dehydrogenase/sirohydrochlorin ferrochelatase
MRYYPVCLNLRGRPCLVVGAGVVGTKKVEGLLSAAADVTVVSPWASQLIQRQARSGKLRYFPRPYRKGDLKGIFLAYAATGVAEIDELMARDARAHGVLLNIVDRTSLCDFITPAVVQRGDLTIAVSTAGQCPGFAKRVKQRIEELIHPGYGPKLAVIADQRRKLMVDSLLDAATRRRLLEEILESAGRELNKEIG